MKPVFFALLGVAVLVVLGSAVVSVPLIEQRFAKPLPVLGKVSSFSMTDSASAPFDQSRLAGKVWVADFFFTSCAGPCPILSGKMASLSRSYLLEDGVRFVSVTVNPEHDTPEVLKEYAGRFGADPAHWHFLTGPKDEIARLAVRDFKIGSKDNPVFHSTKLVLVDKNANIRGYYDGTDNAEVQKLFKDIALLLREKS